MISVNQQGFEILADDHIQKVRMFFPVIEDHNALCQTVCCWDCNGVYDVNGVMNIPVDQGKQAGIFVRKIGVVQSPGNSHLAAQICDGNPVIGDRKHILQQTVFDFYLSVHGMDRVMGCLLLQMDHQPMCFGYYIEKITCCQTGMM